MDDMCKAKEGMNATCKSNKSRDEVSQPNEGMVEM